MVKINDISQLSQDAQGKVYYQGKKLGVFWGKTLFYYDKKNNQLYYKHFNFIELILRSCGYQSRYSRVALQVFFANRVKKASDEAKPTISEPLAQPKAEKSEKKVDNKKKGNKTPQQKKPNETETNKELQAKREAFQKEKKETTDLMAEKNYIDLKGRMELLEKMQDSSATPEAPKPEVAKPKANLPENESEWIQQLNDKKINPNQEIDDNGKKISCLDYACKMNWMQFAKMLIEAGAIYKKSGDFEEDALANAIKYGCLDLIELLVKKGADLNPSLQLGEDSPLCFAVKRRKGIDILKLLTDKGAKKESVPENILEKRYNQLDEGEEKTAFAELFPTISART